MFDRNFERGDKVRLCSHQLVEVPGVTRAVSFGTSNSGTLQDAVRPAPVYRCILCGLVGESGEGWVDDGS